MENWHLGSLREKSKRSETPMCLFDLLIYIYLDPPGVPNGWERVPLSNPLGFKHHPLEGAGMILI